jgi:hypothetical protein
VTTGHRGAPLMTMLLWHPDDRIRVEQALQVALEALDERTSSSRYILDDPHVYGLTDPDQLRAQIEGDDEATAVLRNLLIAGTQPGQ